MVQERSDLILGMKAEQKDMMRALNSLVKQMDTLENVIDDVGDEAEKTAKRTVKAFGKIRGGVEKASNKITKVMGGTAAKLTAVFGIGGFVGLVTKAAKASAGFQSELAKVSTLLGKDAPEKMKKFEKSIRTMATNTSSSVGELTSGLYQVISAGTEGTESVAGSMELLEAAQKAGVAGMSSTFAAVDLLTTALNSYNQGSDKATDFTDKLFIAVKLGKTTFNEMAGSIGRVTSIAAGAGVAFEELTSGIAAMTKGGLSTDIASTALRGTIAAMLKPSKDLTALMKRLGFESAAAALKQKGLLGVMKILNKETKGDTAALQKLIPQMEAIQGAAILAGTGMKNFEEAVKASRNSVGATEDAYKKMAGTFEEKSKRFFNVINEVMLKIGDKLLPIITDKLEDISDWVSQNGDQVAEWVTSIADTVVSLGEFILQHGDKIAITLGSFWAVGKLSQFVSLLTDSKKLLTGLASIGIGTGALGAIAAGGAVVAGGLGALLMASEARKEGEAAGKETRARKAAGLADAFGMVKGMSAENLRAVSSGEDEIARKKFEDMLNQAMSGLKVIGANTRRIMADNLHKGLEILAKQDIKRQAAVKEQAELEWEASEKAKGDENQKNWEVANKKKVLTEKERKKEAAAAKKLQKEREAFFKKLRANEIAAMDKRSQMVAKAADEKYKIEKEAEKLKIDGTIAVGMSEMKWKKKIAKFDKKQLDDKLAKWQKIIDKETSRRQGVYDIAETVAARGAGGLAASRYSHLPGGSEEGLGGGYGEVFKKSINFGAMAQDMTDVMVRVVEFGGKSLLKVMDTASDVIMVPFNQISDIFFAALGGADMEQLQGMLDGFVEMFTGLADNIDGILEWVANEAAPKIITAFVNALPIIIDAVIEHAPTLIMHIVNAIPVILQALIQKLPFIIGAIVELLPQIIKAFIDMIPVIVAEFIKAIPVIAYEVGKEIAKVIAKTITGDWGGDTSWTKGEEGILPDEIPLVGKLHSGGMVKHSMLKFDGSVANFTNAIKAHSGKMLQPNISPSEVPIIAEIGESVLNKQATKNIGGEAGVNAWNSGKMTGGPSQTVVNNWNVGHMFSQDSEKVVDDLMASGHRKGNSKMAKIQRGKSVPGFKPRRG